MGFAGCAMPKVSQTTERAAVTSSAVKPEVGTPRKMRRTGSMVFSWLAMNPSMARRIFSPTIHEPGMRRSDFAGSRMPPMEAAAWRSLICFLFVAGGPLRNVGLLTGTAVVVAASQSLAAAGDAEPGSGTRETED